MIPVGNDIVDLSNVRPFSKPYYTRLRSYALNETELELPQHQPFEHFWVMWSIKEACYKSTVKLGNRERFKPKSIEIRTLASGKGMMLGEAQFRGQTFATKTTMQNSLIHTICGDAMYSGVERLDTQKHKEQSRRAREMAMSAVSGHFDVDTFALSVRKDDRQVPGIFLNQKMTIADLSLSHHGYFSGFALSL